jgi:hypothetical protein
MQLDIKNTAEEPFQIKPETNQNCALQDGGLE